MTRDEPVMKSSYVVERDQHGFLKVISVRVLLASVYMVSVQVRNAMGKSMKQKGVSLSLYVASMSFMP